MTKLFVTRDGSPDYSFGVRPVDPEIGTTPGVTVHTPEDDLMADKVEKSGVYTLNGKRFRISAGDVLPEGATLDGEAQEERKRVETPENRAKSAAPENRAAKKAEK